MNEQTPTRIQLKRSRGWRIPPGAVKVDRSTWWGNPYRVSESASAAQTVQALRAEIEKNGFFTGLLKGRSMKINRSMIEQKLKGKSLACWCPLESACHADLLLEIANGK